MNWKRMLATISGSVDQELLLRNEYLVTENRILKNQIKGRLQLTDPERISLAEIGQCLGRKALEEVAQIVRPETILGWHRRLVAKKFDGSKNRSPAGRPNTDNSIEELILKMARENRSWGYRRIVGALSNLGYEVSHQTVGNVLERHGLENYVNHFHVERNHPGKGKVILFPAPEDRIGERAGDIHTRESLGGLLKFYYRDAA